MPETRLVTAEDFYAMPDDRPRELVRGEVVEMSRPGFRHGELAGWIYHLLLSAGAAGAGFRAVVGDPGFLIERDPDTVRGPDVALVRRDRVEGLDDRKWLPFAPDLAVEVVSPSNSFAEVEAKARMWLECGTNAVWVVEPETRRVFVYRAGAPREDLSGPDVLTGGDLFPAFSVTVDRIFEGVPQ